MLKLDQERLDTLRPQLETHGINVDNLPPPGTPEWDAVVRQVTAHDLTLAQEFAALPYDPDDQMTGRLVNDQMKQSNNRGAFGKQLKASTRTKTVNGDDVPNTKLVRNAIFGVGVALLVGFYFWNPSPAAKTATKPVASDTSTTATAGADGTTTADTGASVATPEQSNVNPDGSSKPDPLGLNTLEGGASGTTGSTTAGTQGLEPDTTVANTGTSTTPITPVPSYTPSSPSYDSPSIASRSDRLDVTPTPTPAPTMQVRDTPRTTLTAPPTVVLTPATPAQQTATAAPAPRLASGGQQSATPTRDAAPSRPNLVQGNGGASNSGAQTASRTPERRTGLQSAPATTAATAAERRVGIQTGNAGAATGNATATPAAAAPRTTGLSTVTSAAAAPAAGANTARATGTPGLVASQAPAPTTANTSSAAGQGNLGMVTRTSQAEQTTNAQTTTSAQYGLMTSQQPGGQGSGQAQAAGQNSQQYGLLSSSRPAATPPTATAAAAAATVTLPPAPYQMGQELAARLTTVAAAADGVKGEMPVYAQSEDGSIWRGEASLDSRKRLQISFNTVLKDNRQYAVVADAYSADRQPGLAVSVKPTAPTAAYDLLSAVFRGAQGFVQAQLAQKTVTYQQGLSGGTSTTSNTTAPNFWLLTGAGVAGAFALPENRSPSVILVGQANSGTTLRLIVRSMEATR
ncbi:hypothetical protein [Deinococcus sp. Leaf326]|uniref:hypothetical protein n=1 Tax=Deinococcus sp. Leaf326 TaxID=1736338 RepID=UPI0006F69484|nr:hypothetical protein [Deinococcus sp. Leaf326]KQR25610.1 hypothetical protein ASF71_18930 [Deinococcus sp. Leaf326]